MSSSLPNKELVFTRFLDHAPSAVYILGVGTKGEWNRINSRYPNTPIHGVEPVLSTYRSLKDDFPDTLLQKAIGRPLQRTTTLYVNKERPDSSSVFPGVGRESVPTEVYCITLDEFDDYVGKPDNIVLWLDIEGSELIALKSGRELLESGRVSLINIELRDSPNIDGWPSSRLINSLLASYNFNQVTKYLNQGTHYDAIYTPARR